MLVLSLALLQEPSYIYIAESALLLRELGESIEDEPLEDEQKENPKGRPFEEYQERTAKDVPR